MNRAKVLLAVSAVALGVATNSFAVPKQGAQFNGMTSYAVVEDGSPFDLDAFTLAAWVKLSQTGGSQIFVGRGGAGNLFTLYLLNGRVRMLVEYAEGKYTHADADAPPRDQWTHFAGTYDGREIKIFVNGRLQDTVEAQGRMPESSAALYLGALGLGERVLHGSLEDVCIWGRALAEEEVAAVAQGADASPPPAGLVARWPSRSLAAGQWKSAGPVPITAAYHAEANLVCREDDGYRGIWYSNQRQDDEYVYKYSGGLGTYCAKHRPFAVYAPEVNKTFFCYGGTPKGKNTLLHMVSYYDHATGKVPRPRVLLAKNTDDAHDNPVISLDDKGHIWIFSSSHGTSRPSYVSVSTKPYSIDEFELVSVTNFSYTQPYFVPGRGFLFLHTRYQSGHRRLFQMTSPDGRTWSEPELLAYIEQGHYQISWICDGKVGTAFNFHPAPKGLNWRTNLYYMETDDFGKTWRTAQGEVVELPLTTPDNPALVHDYRAEGLNVYMKDLAFDAQGRPVILYLTSGGWESGPKNDPRTWSTARWTGSEWDVQGSIVSDNNYDTGSLYVESDDLWRIIGPTQPGPQRYNTGGEVAIWTSSDHGKTWQMARQVTQESPLNHGYCRKPIRAHPDFYALWADGHGRQLSESRLYFCDKEGNLRRLPPVMDAELARPE